MSSKRAYAASAARRRPWGGAVGGALAAAAGLGMLLTAFAQSRAPHSTLTEEFHFARMIYTDSPNHWRGGGGRGWWRQDWPDAETHFRQGIERLTRLNVGQAVVVELTDDALFDYPWLYATQVGYWDLSDEEIARLREYLERGGFLMADDFFGDEWFGFEQAMFRLFPDRPIVDIDVGTHEVLHVLYDVDEFTQIPGLRHLGGGWGGRRGRGGGFEVASGLPEPHLRGILDDEGRLMIAVNYNQDVGDAWEHADDAYYPAPMTALAYRFGVNYIVYAMTH
jgi:hypothetical protein